MDSINMDDFGHNQQVLNTGLLFKDIPYESWTGCWLCFISLGGIFLGIIFVVIGPIIGGSGIIPLCVIGGLLILCSICSFCGYVSNMPNEAVVVSLCGKYLGTIATQGLHWINPFTGKDKISMRAEIFEAKAIKVNDKRGSPIEIGAIVVYKVKDIAKCLYQVQNYREFIRNQSEAAIRHLAGLYVYDSNGENEREITLLNGLDEVSRSLMSEINERVENAGVGIIEARISHLAYSEEIANQMLKKQQAEALIAARKKIVYGTVSMVELTLKEIEKRGLLELNEQNTSNLVNSLVITLCSEQPTTQVITTGTSLH